MRYQTSAPSLAAVPGHYAHFSKAFSPFLATVLRNTPQNETACEVRCGAGYASIWLSQRAVRAEARDESAVEVERGKQINSILNGKATFLTQNLFDFHGDATKRWAVVHHQGLIHRYAVPWIHALLAQQERPASCDSVAVMELRLFNMHLLPVEILSG